MRYILLLLLITSSLTYAQRKKGPDIAPAEGSVAPELKAQKLDSEEFVDLGKLKKTTVLIFGSYT